MAGCTHVDGGRRAAGAAARAGSSRRVARVQYCTFVLGKQLAAVRSSSRNNIDRRFLLRAEEPLAAQRAAATKEREEMEVETAEQQEHSEHTEELPQSAERRKRVQRQGDQILRAAARAKPLVSHSSDSEGSVL